MTSSIRERLAKAAFALEPLGLSLVLHGPSFLITDKPDDPQHSGREFSSIDAVEEFITDCQRIDAVAAPLKPSEPYTGAQVHYVSHSELPPRCRAAFVTELTEVEVNEQDPAGDGIYRQTVGLMVANPTGTDFLRGLLHDPGTFTGPERTANPGEPLPLVTCDDLTFEGGTWHWPGGQ
jgi:hypothetical protein